MKFKAVREIGLVTVCQSERSCSSLVDEFDVWLILPTLCEIGELVHDSRRSQLFAGTQSGSCVTSGGIVVADAVDRAELSASGPSAECKTDSC